jgi:trans-2-enoyl-CoA reductase
MIKPKPVLWIPANAEARNPDTWANSESLCRTCIYQFLGEPFCKTVYKEGKWGITKCDGYEKETGIDSSLTTNAFP